MNPIFEREFFSFVARPRFFVLRAGVVAAIVVTLIFVASEVGNHWKSDRIGALIFTATSMTLLSVALVVTPGMFASLISDERRLRTLEVLRTTVLSSRALVLGKWGSRLALLAAILLAAVPLVASSLIFGGVAPTTLGHFLAILAATLVWTSALSIFVSSHSKEVGTAYGLVIGCGLVTAVAVPLFFAVQSGNYTGPIPLGSPELWATIMHLNPFVVLMYDVEPRTMVFMAASVPFGLDPWIYYTLTSLLFSSLLLALAIRSVEREERLWAIRQKPSAVKASSTQPRLRRRAPWLLHRAPLVWLEVNRGFLRHKWLRSIAMIVVVVGFEAIFIFNLRDIAIEAEYHSSRLASMEYLARETVGWHVVAIAGAAILSLLSVTGAGSRAFQRDRDQNTIEVLHATPMSSPQIVHSKCLGTLYQGLSWWLLAMLHGVVAVVIGSIHWGGVLAFGVISAILITAMATFSLTVSLRSRTVVRASVFTSLGFLVFCILIPIVLGLFFEIAGVREEVVQNLFFGYHPGYIAAVPLIIGVETSDAASGYRSFTSYNDGWWMTMAYLVVYAAVAWYLLQSKLPVWYETRRRENWLGGKGS